MKVEMSEREALAFFRAVEAIAGQRPKSRLKEAWEAVKAEDVSTPVFDEDDFTADSASWSEAQSVELYNPQDLGAEPAVGPGMREAGIELPHENSASPVAVTSASGIIPSKNGELPRLTPEYEAELKAEWVNFIRLWATNFGVADAPQPQRMDALESLGSSRFAIGVLIKAYELKSLQRWVFWAMNEAIILPTESYESRLHTADLIAGNLVQVCHRVFPDLAGTYDYSTKWRRQ